MDKDVIRKNFLIQTAIILLSVLCLGVVLLIVSSRHLISDKNKLLTKQFGEVRTYTQGLNKDEYRSDKIKTFYKDYAEKMNCNIILCDISGKVLASTDEKIVNKKISKDIIYDISKIPKSFCTNLGGLYSEKNCIMAGNFNNDNSLYFLFLTYPTNNFGASVSEIMNYYLISAIIIVLALLISSYIITTKLTKPFIDICNVAKNFAKGDFSQRAVARGTGEFRELANALNDMADSISNGETMRKSFITNVSHELRTPMTSISGFVDGIIDGTIPEEQRDKYMEIVSQETKRLSRLVVSMINMAKLEAGEIKLNYAYFDLMKMTLKCLFTFEKQINSKKIDISGLDNESIMVYADYDLIYQVVYNLIENAIKFVDKKGYIKFSITSVENVIRFSIKNSGQGIKQKEFKLIFDKFYKADQSRSLDSSGLGLGLYLSNSIINMHNGKIKVDSIEGLFTEFVFTIRANIN